MMKFKRYPTERLLIDSIASRLTDPEKALRRWLMESIIDSGGPINAREALSDSRTSPEVPAILDRLIEKRAIVLDGGGNIQFSYPVSALPTHHKVQLQDGRSFSAMCAVDALGAAFTFEQDTTVSSQCSECGRPVLVRVQSGEITELSPDTLRVLHVDLNQVENWAAGC
jgi:hypothetical protein